jgi:hypothetical protein
MDYGQTRTLCSRSSLHSIERRQSHRRILLVNNNIISCFLTQLRLCLQSKPYHVQHKYIWSILQYMYNCSAGFPLKLSLAGVAHNVLRLL